MNANSTPSALFPLGQVVATLGALEVLDKEAVNASVLLQRHQSGDCGIVPEEDAQENHAFVANGSPSKRPSKCLSILGRQSVMVEIGHFTDPATTLFSYRHQLRLASPRIIMQRHCTSFATGQGIRVD